MGGQDQSVRGVFNKRVPCQRWISCPSEVCALIKEEVGEVRIASLMNLHGGMPASIKKQARCKND